LYDVFSNILYRVQEVTSHKLK